MIISYEKRNNFRNLILNYIKKHKHIEWALHPYSENYAISIYGQVKNIHTGKILKAYPNRNGYLLTNINYPDGSRKSKMIHRLVLETFLSHFDNKENIYEVNHINGNKTDNSLENLEWNTRSENLEHARQNKLFKSSKGMKNNNCKFSDSDVQLMREMFKEGIKISEIARLANSDRNYISRIVRGIVR